MPPRMRDQEAEITDATCCARTAAEHRGEPPRLRRGCTYSAGAERRIFCRSSINRAVGAPSTSIRAKRGPVHPRRKPRPSTCLLQGVDVDDRLREIRQLVVGVALFIERPLQQLRVLVQAKH